MKPLVLLSLLASSTAAAGEQAMSFTITGRTVQPGRHQLLLSTTPRFGRPREYLRFDNLAGVTLGLAPTLEAQLLLAFTVESIGVDGKAAEGGGQLRLRWQPLDAEKDAVGLGLWGTVGAGSESLFLEGRVGAQAQLGQFLLALNASLDYLVRWVRAPLPELHLEQSAGIIYRLAGGFTTGFELRNRLGFERGSYYGDAVYFGPVFSFRRGPLWACLAALPQVAAVKAPAVVGNGEPLELRDNERVVLRLQLGLDTD